ncbi:D-glycero-beta-D-manno-heptose 1,7-bisphosphate 7-phosphatase [bacterium]|nr:D-glycero-beta-D-manno-heptose 1,7-bisphosphate 7-phosphatase [bacterium]
MKNKACFLDRDGVINEEAGYIRSPEQLKLFSFAGPAIKLLNEKGIKAIVVTNQSGIGRGYFDRKALDEIHRKLRSELAKEGAFLDGIYYCPHHPDNDCHCRKPKPGLFLKAAGDFDLDLGRCCTIGDKLTDLEAGREAGTKTILVLTGYGKEVLNSKEDPIFDCKAKNLLEAVKILTTI